MSNTNQLTKEKQMENKKAAQVIRLLFQAEDIIEESDFTSLLVEQDNGFRERAIKYIKNAAEEIDKMRAEEDK